MILATLLVGAVAFYAFDLDNYVTVQVLEERQAVLRAFVADHAWFSVLTYGVAYVALVACGLPGGFVMTIAGGFLFGAIAGSICAVIAATIGATMLFLAARTAIGEPLRAKFGPSVQKVEAGFRRNAGNYLVMLRIIPVMPFVVVNLAPAFLGVNVRTYVISTLIGLVPPSYVLANFGAGLDSYFEAGMPVSLSAALSPEIIIGLAGLAFLALLPVLFKRVLKRYGSA